MEPMQLCSYIFFFNIIDNSDDLQRTKITNKYILGFSFMSHVLVVGSGIFFFLSWKHLILSMRITIVFRFYLDTETYD